VANPATSNFRWAELCNVTTQVKKTWAGNSPKSILADLYFCVFRKERRQFRLEFFVVKEGLKPEQTRVVVNMMAYMRSLMMEKPTGSVSFKFHPQSDTKHPLGQHNTEPISCRRVPIKLPTSKIQYKN